MAPCASALSSRPGSRARNTGPNATKKPAGSWTRKPTTRNSRASGARQSDARHTPERKPADTDGSRRSDSARRRARLRHLPDASAPRHAAREQKGHRLRAGRSVTGSAGGLSFLRQVAQREPAAGKAGRTHRPEPLHLGIEKIVGDHEGAHGRTQVALTCGDRVVDRHFQIGEWLFGELLLVLLLALGFHAA